MKIKNERYSIGYQEDNIKTLNSETLNVQETFNLNITIVQDSQHDGRCWDDEFIECLNSQIEEQLLNDLKLIVKEKIKQIDPYAAHRDFSK